MFFTGGDVISSSREKDPPDSRWQPGLEESRAEGGREAPEAVVILNSGDSALLQARIGSVVLERIAWLPETLGGQRVML